MVTESELRSTRLVHQLYALLVWIKHQPFLTVVELGLRVDACACDGVHPLGTQMVSL